MVDHSCNTCNLPSNSLLFSHPHPHPHPPLTPTPPNIPLIESSSPLYFAYHSIFTNRKGKLTCTVGNFLAVVGSRETSTRTSPLSSLLPLPLPPPGKKHPNPTYKSSILPALAPPRQREIRNRNQDPDRVSEGISEKPFRFNLLLE